MFLVAVELKPQHIGNILKTRKERTSGKSTVGFGKFNRNPWQILVTEVEAILQPPPSARHWGFVTFATSQQAMDAKVIVVQSGICHAKCLVFVSKHDDSTKKTRYFKGKHHDLVRSIDSDGDI